MEFSKLSERQKDYRMYAVIAASESLDRDFEKLYAALFAAVVFSFALYFLLLGSQLLGRTMIDWTIVFSVLTALFLWTCFNIVFGSIIKVFFPDFFNKYKD